jgi:protein-export membrane protein SecD
MMGWSRWKVWAVMAVCLLGVIYAVPSVVPSQRLAGLPEWVPHRQVSLGLDLQGGVHLLWGVEVSAVQRERLNNLLDGIRTAMRPLRIAVTGLAVLPDNTGVTFRVRDAPDVEKARTAVRELDRTVQISTQPDGTFTLRYDPREIAENSRRALAQSVEIVRRRIDELGTKDPTIQAQGDDRILVQVPGLRDPEELKRIIGQTAKMTFHLVDMSAPVSDARQGRVPEGTLLLPSDHEVEQDGRPRMYLVQRRVAVSGERLTDAQPGTNSQTGEWVVNFKFDGVGARQFGQITRDNVGRPFAVVLDGKVITAPVIREPILGGSGQISGSFTARSASDLAVLLRAGALPAPLTVLEERTVGPDLGSDSIRAGTIACIIGYVLIVVLMIAGYGLFGIIANIALLMNLAFTLAIMAAIGATLTLPGIAGMVLGLAMAVDANVLIYERMREETDAGRSPFPAVDAAFQRAFGTILDSNLTTLIAALLLYMFGSGPVRGFAVTLSIGIACSMFTAVTVTKLMVVGYLTWRRPKALPI